MKDYWSSLFKRVRLKSKSVQLEFDIERKKEKDRNYHLGGRSFYFFDFDDNVAFLSTPLIIFSKKDRKKEIELSSGEFAKVHSDIGIRGVYANYFIDPNDEVGTFRCFRDRKLNLYERWQGKKQLFIEDVNNALKQPDLHWKGPSWPCFYHATFNHRPLSVITARGHHPDTIKQGIYELVKQGFLPNEPNYLCVFPVSNIQVRKEQLGDPDLKLSVPELKKRAIRLSVEKAIEVYGYNSYHRFGMSDDDPKNIALIVDEMSQLKKDYSEMCFFAIETCSGKYVKREVFVDHTESSEMTQEEQLSFHI